MIQDSNYSVTTIASSSAGNGYIIESFGDKILLEAGVDPKKVLRFLNFSLQNLNAILVSHSHGDHAKYLRNWNALKQYVFTPYNLEADKKTDVFNWSIIAIPAVHDVPCYSYFIRHKISEVMFFFCTDTGFINYESKYMNLYKNTNILMIEANHDEDVLKVENHDKRVINNHLSIQKVCEMFDIIDFKQLQEIYLMHLSDINSNAEKFKNKLIKKTGKIVNICQKN